MTDHLQPKISFNIEADILSCFITGERSEQSVLPVWQQLLKQCEQNQLSLVQVTLALRGKYQPFKAIENYRAVVALLKPANLTLAVIDLNHLSSSDTQVACHMGYIKGLNVKYFDSQNSAKNWLQQQSNLSTRNAESSTAPTSSGDETNQSGRDPLSSKSLA